KRTTGSQQPEVIQRCSPYFISDFNIILRLDGLKSGYSAEMSGLCSNFSNKYADLQQCSAFEVKSRAPETVKTEMVKIICGRNERLAATGAVPPGVEAALIKFMILDDQPYAEVRESSKIFSARKAFSGGKTIAINTLGQNSKTAFCLLSSTLPLNKEDIVLV